MDYTYEIYEVEGGFGYRILQCGNAIIVQDFNPYMSGFAPMTEEEAHLYGNEVLQRVLPQPE